METVPNIGGKSKEEKKQFVMQTIQQQQNIENARVLIENINTKCFEKCVPKPANSLSNAESTCMKSCMQKYLAAWNTVSASYVARIKSDPSSS